MNSKQASTAKTSVGVMIGLSIPFIFIVLGIISAWISESQGFADTSTEQAVFFGGLYLAIPCGLINVFVGIKALSKGLIKKWLAITGIMIGIFSVLIGLLSWAWYFMIWSFTNHFG